MLATMVGRQWKVKRKHQVKRPKEVTQKMKFAPKYK